MHSTLQTVGAYMERNLWQTAGSYMERGLWQTDGSYTEKGPWRTDTVFMGTDRQQKKDMCRRHRKTEIRKTGRR